MNRRHAARAGLVFLALGLVSGCNSQEPPPPPAASPETVTRITNVTREPDVIYVPTRQELVDKMVEMAEIKPNDIVYDLGCGDGRIVVTAAKKYGVKAVGVDIDPQRVSEALENVRTNNLSHLVTIKQADIFEIDFSEATVVMLYLLPELNVKLMPKLAQLKPGTRILSNDFDMEGAKPKEVFHLEKPLTSQSEYQRTIYKWVVPWEAE